MLLMIFLPFIDNGNTPLMKACYRSNNTIIKYLLSKGADASIVSYEVLNENYL